MKKWKYEMLFHLLSFLYDFCQIFGKLCSPVGIHVLAVSKKMVLIHIFWMIGKIEKRNAFTLATVFDDLCFMGLGRVAFIPYRTLDDI